MEKLVKTLDFQNQADLLCASREDLQKVKIKDQDITEHTIQSVYARAATLMGVDSKDCFEHLVRELDGIKHFKTGVDELDKCL